MPTVTSLNQTLIHSCTKNKENRVKEIANGDGDCEQNGADHWTIALKRFGRHLFDLWFMAK